MLFAAEDAPNTQEGRLRLFDLNAYGSISQNRVLVKNLANNSQDQDLYNRVKAYIRKDLATFFEQRLEDEKSGLKRDEQDLLTQEAAQNCQDLLENNDLNHLQAIYQNMFRFADHAYAEAVDQLRLSAHSEAILTGQTFDPGTFQVDPKRLKLPEFINFNGDRVNVGDKWTELSLGRSACFTKVWPVLKDVFDAAQWSVQRRAHGVVKAGTPLERACTYAANFLSAVEQAYTESAPIMRAYETQEYGTTDGAETDDEAVDVAEDEVVAQAAGDQAVPNQAIGLADLGNDPAMTMG